MHYWENMRALRSQCVRVSSIKTRLSKIPFHITQNTIRILSLLLYCYVKKLNKKNILISIKVRVFFTVNAKIKYLQSTQLQKRDDITQVAI